MATNEPPPPAETVDAEYWAEMFHEVYERRAPDFGYHTRPESAVSWDALSEGHKGLMITTVREVLAAALAQGRAEAEKERDRFEGAWVSAKMRAEQAEATIAQQAQEKNILELVRQHSANVTRELQDARASSAIDELSRDAQELGLDQTSLRQAQEIERVTLVVDAIEAQHNFGNSGDLDQRIRRIAAALSALTAERDRLRADQQDWRKGVAFIASCLGDHDSNLSCVRIGEIALRQRADLESVSAELAALQAHRGTP